MKQKEKDLLLKDLCGRLPYRIKCSFGVDDAVYEITGINPSCCGASEIQATHVKSSINGDFKLGCCKPYLFPLSSMTEEQKEEYNQSRLKDLRMLNSVLMERISDENNFDRLVVAHNEIDWLNKNHFDYRGLIPMGLAIDCTNLGIY